MKTYLMFFIFLSLGFGLIFDIPVENLNYTIEKVQGYDRILLKNGVCVDKPGAPDIPVITYTYSLLPNQTLKQIEILEQEWSEIPGNFYLYPVQKSVSMEKTREFTEPNQEIYNSELGYPNSPVVNYSCGNLRGHRIVQVSIAPFSYVPQTCQLLVLKKLRLKVQTNNCEPGIVPMRQSSLSKDLFERFVSSIILNEVKTPFCAVEENPLDLLPTDLPSLLGPPVDLVIITTEPLIQAYESFARLKKLFGFNTVIKTLTWIRQHYPGVDDAERIRNFLKEAVEQWGAAYVLLGGDTGDIPTRYVWMNNVDFDPWPEHIVTDLYFSDLDKNWNDDGDERFGEDTDSIDLYPEVFVARLPMTSSVEVLGYLNKLYSYLFPLDTGMQIKALFFTSDLEVVDDAYLMAQELAAHLPPYFIKSFLNEKPLQDLKDSIYSGFGIITGIGHGDANLIRVRNSPRENATNFFYDSLTNTDRYAMMFVITCYTNPFQGDCLGEHWVKNTAGAGIGYIGPTSSSEGYIHKEYTIVQFDSLFAFPLGAVLAKTKIPFIPQSQSDNWFRVYQFSINLLGDPTLALWDSIPMNFSSVVVNPETLNLGWDTIAVSLIPAIDSFYVIYYKENEVFVKDSGVGNLLTPVKTNSPGYLKYTILSDGYVAHIDSIFVQPISPYLIYNNHRIVDTLQNSNGILNPGEDIFLFLSLKNNGSAIANAVSAQILSLDSLSLITVITDTASYPDIGVGEIKENLTPFYFKVANSIPDEHSLNFRLEVNYSGTNNSDSFQLIAQSPKLRLFTQHYEIIDDSLRILPYIENQGHSLADSVSARISAYSDTILVIDSLVNFPNIPPGAIVSSQPDSFKAYLTLPGGSLVYNLRGYYRKGEVVNQKIMLNTPARPGSIRALGMKDLIDLEWMSVSGTIGYRIYRATNPLGPYQFLKNPLTPVSYFEDFNVQAGINYFYYLFAVDSSMNEGLISDTVCALTNPQIALGWPNTVYEYIYSSPNFEDIDPSYPGFEVVVCGRDGAVYAWHYNGTPVVGDGRLFDITPAEVWSSPAIGDVNNDGALDIVFGVRRTWDNLYAITPSDTGGMWRCLPGYPKTVPGRIIGSCVLADINKDDSLEIFVWTEWADVYAFYYDGQGLYSPTGLLKDCLGNALGTLAIGDINKDGDLEIVSCGGSWSDSLFVWDRYGNYLSPFPVFIQPEYRLRCSVVLGDVVGDNRLEISFFADSTRRVYLVNADGVILWFRNLDNLEVVEANPIFADITGDGRPEIICGSNPSGFLYAYDSLGNSLPNFPLISLEHGWKLPAVFDVDNDNWVDIVLGSTDWNLYALKDNGGIAVGFPIKFGNWIASSPATYDLDLDGKLELMFSANDFKFYVFDLNSTHWEWPKFRYDQYNTGCYKSGNLPGVKEIARRFTPDALRLRVYPNPSFGKINIRFMIQNSRFMMPKKQIQDTGYRIQDINLKIYDITGRLVRDLSNNLVSCIMNHVSVISWEGTDDLGRQVPSGVYFVRLVVDPVGEAGDYKRVEKVVLLR